MNSTIIYIALVISFTLYHISYFSFTCYIFEKNSRSVLFGVLTGIINLSFWILYANSHFLGAEHLAMISFLILLFFEIKVVFKVSNLYALFISLAFTINTFTKRMMVLSVLAIMHDMSFIQAASNMDFHYYSLILSFTLSLSTIAFSRKNLKRIHLDTILSDRQNMVFATTVLSLFTISISIFDIIGTNVSSEIVLLNYHYFVLGLVSLLGFGVVIIYAYFLAELRLNVEDYNRISIENSQQEEVLKRLETEASTDFLTGLQTRDLADSLINTYVAEKEKFFITFMDMDGLKIANDNYGHDEGDFYIKAVARILSREFQNELVCRYGGDEFIIIGSYKSEADIHMKTLKCYNKILNIQNTYSKPYETSISYGTVFATYTNTLPAEKLIAIADQRMYIFKKDNNKNRKR